MHGAEVKRTKFIWKTCTVGMKRQVLEEAVLSTSNEIRDFEANAAKQIVDLKLEILVKDWRVT